MQEAGHRESAARRGGDDAEELAEANPLQQRTEEGVVGQVVLVVSAAHWTHACADALRREGAAERGAVAACAAECTKVRSANVFHPPFGFNM